MITFDEWNLLFQVLPRNEIIHIKETMNAMRLVSHLHQTAVRTTARIIPYPSGHEVSKWHSIPLLKFHQPFRYFLIVFLKINVQWNHIGSLVNDYVMNLSLKKLSPRAKGSLTPIRKELTPFAELTPFLTSEIKLQSSIISQIYIISLIYTKLR